MSKSSLESRRPALLKRRKLLTDALVKKPYDMVSYLRRALVYADLAYPDLAIGDAYRALLLTEELEDDCCKYNKQPYESMKVYADDLEKKGLPDVLRGMTPGNELPKKASWSGGYYDGYGSDDSVDWDDELDIHGSDDDFERDPVPLIIEKLAWLVEVRCCQIISLNLFICGCFASASVYCLRGRSMTPRNKALQKMEQLIDVAGFSRSRQSGVAYSPMKLPDRGLVRREVYPWNTHEPDRCLPASLAFLNAQLAEAAPKCEVRAIQLPVLTEQGSSESTAAPENWQLGIFAKESIAAGEVVLREYSLLTANNRHKDALCDACDACGAALPSLTTNSAANGGGGVSCGNCGVVFCDKFCHDQAQQAYHKCLCRKKTDIDVGDPEDSCVADGTLYVLLLERLLAMSHSQSLHPLDVKEVKYLWGDFVPAATNERDTIGPGVSATSRKVADFAHHGAFSPAAWSLPFNFDENIVRPLSFMEKMGLNIYENVEKLDVWVLNTLFAKLRGTASARKSRQDGPPDVAAVHPLWSLANHDCDPNVTWEWGGRMVLRAKEERVQLAEDKAAGVTRPGGIGAGQEILSHYCDLALPVQLRREWARGSLGGICMCQRCQNEASTERRD
ncbi:hypothetical protein SEPCBS119000_000707 [Sporothrix epigloea]|uniref:SET domain-containing protein n=1 Tax=Sporothrix epigloea TaxID=1892477 RepID=A0ABP0D892_9PEZI